jgi:hypothetical protein
MTVLTLALLAGSQPAAPRLAPVHQIGPQSRRQSPHTPCAPLVRTDALTLTWQKADRHKRSAPTSSSHTPWPNPHSACGTAAAPLPAISCLGAFRPPAARARGEVRHCRQPKTCTEPDICQVILVGMHEASAALGGRSSWGLKIGGLGLKTGRCDACHSLLRCVSRPMKLHFCNTCLRKRPSVQK